jgi:CheY-like chemotaxis protein
MKIQAGEIFIALQTIQDEKFTGTANFESLAENTEQSFSGALLNSSKYIFAFYEGAIVYVGKKLPTPIEFANWMRSKMKLHHLESTLNVVSSRIKNESSLRELLDFISRFGLVRWEDLEMVMHKEIALIMEQLILYPGAFADKISSNSFDLCYGEDRHGLSLSSIRKALNQRQQLWQSLAPNVSPQTAPLLRLEESDKITPSVLPHLQKWANGKFKIKEIAATCGEDPLQLAQAYLLWAEQGWIELRQNKAVRSLPTVLQVEEDNADPGEDRRPIILSLDDSKIVQAMVKKAVGDIYNVVLADNALDALEILNRQQVSLMLLDVTMPDVDGLELCRNIRAMGKFKDLPIVMLTAKDGLIDKIKSQFAGSTHYLTKPVDREKLLPVLEKYISKATVAR